MSSILTLLKQQYENHSIQTETKQEIKTKQLLFDLLLKQKFNIVQLILQQLRSQYQKELKLNQRNKKQSKNNDGQNIKVIENIIDLNQYLSYLPNKTQLLTIAEIKFFVHNIFMFRPITAHQAKILSTFIQDSAFNDNQLKQKCISILQRASSINNYQRIKKQQKKDQPKICHFKLLLQKQLPNQKSLNNILYKQDKLSHEDLHIQINLLIDCIQNSKIQQVQQYNTTQIKQNCQIWWTQFIQLQQLVKFCLFKHQNQQIYLNQLDKQTYSQTIHRLLELYHAKIMVIYENYLKQGLQNDLKNNFYLSQLSQQKYVFNLTHMINYWLQIFQSSSTLPRQALCQQLLEIKTIQLSSLNELTQTNEIKSLINNINDTVKNIFSFFLNKNKQNRLLSNQQIENKVLASINYKENQVKLFKKWFSIHSYNVQINSKNIQYLSFFDKSWEKINRNILIHCKSNTIKKQFAQNIISLIIGINGQLKQADLNEDSLFFKDSFKFYSPTFNQQYLTFNYIMGDPKEQYFYQNHHYSHVLLSLYKMMLNQVIKKNDIVFIYKIFEVLRKQLGMFGKKHLTLPNSTQFYIELNLLKLCFITLSKPFLQCIPLTQLILLFDLILSQMVVRQNHPIMRQYIQLIFARVYFIIKKLSFSDSRFIDCRNRMINLLHNQGDQHNLNIGVPILLIIGYQLLQYIQHNSQHLVYTNPNNIKDQYGATQILNGHQTDIHYVLIKYIICHIAYLRAICQFYLSKYLILLKDQNKPDPLLQNLLSFWQADKDSIKIMSNISIVVEGFKKQMTLFNQNKADNFYLDFERVYQIPSQTVLYFFNKDMIKVLHKLAKSNFSLQSYRMKHLFIRKIINLQEQMLKFEQKQLNNMILVQKSKIIQIGKAKDAKFKKQEKKNAKGSNKPNKQQVKKKQLKQQLQQKQVAINRGKLISQLYMSLLRVSQVFQQTCEPQVIIIASLLQKVHNFGYLIRTLTSHNTLLTVPSKQPFLNPQCIELMPCSSQIDVKVIQLKIKDLQGFIKMQQRRGYPLIALEQCSKSQGLSQVKFPKRFMLLLGNQRVGAPSSLLNLADILVEIPQIGKVRSLNVHVSMVICFWEYLKQHHDAQKSKTKSSQNSEQNSKYTIIQEQKVKCILQQK